jgi:hypothetical protein
VFRPSVYRGCLRLLKSWFWTRDEKNLPPPAHMALMLVDNRNAPWKRARFPKPTFREALYAARVYHELGRNGTRLADFLPEVCEP